MRFTAALVISALVASAAILAQPSARMTLTSGDTLDAQLIDLSAVGFTVRVGGNERQIPKNDVALIDFGGGGAEPRELENLGGQHLLVLKNGSVVRGELIDIGGASPLRLTVRTNGGERDFSSNDVARIYLRRPPAAQPPPAASQLPQEGVVVRVQANQRWTPTNIRVRRGQTVRFEAGGEVELAEGGAVKSGPGGTSNRDPGAPMPSVSTGTLIGRVESGGIRMSGGASPFIIGGAAAVTMPNDGTLFLGVNDSQLIDNRGSYEVRISVR